MARSRGLGDVYKRQALGRGGVNSGAVVGVTTTSGVPQGKESIGDVSAKMAEPKKQAN
jgi:hypothetical protein